MKKIIESKRKKNIAKLLPYILMYSLVLTACDTKADTVETESTVTIDEIIEVSTEKVENIPLSVEPTIESEQVKVEIEQPIVEEPSTEVIIPEEPEEVIEKKLVALTFDDGPSKYTSDLVDILNDNGAHATFFLIGNKINANSDAVVKAYESGNEIAIHTYTHTSFTKMSIEDVIKEIELTRSIIEELEVEPANLVRPPYGSTNSTIRDSIDTSFILWSVDTRDWESRNVESIKEEVYKAISEGDIILFHDIYSTTIEAVRELLPELSEEYEFVTVTELFNRNEKELEEHVNYRHGRK